jgi:predicted NBD/HSP70 family sugar kinase
MPKLNVVVPHQLTTEEAKGRIQGMVSEAMAKYSTQVSDFSESWNGDQGKFSGRAMGFSVSGTVDVRPGEVAINGNLPLAASMFKGKIEEMIRERAGKLLA